MSSIICSKPLDSLLLAIVRISNRAKTSSPSYDCM
jgi:hypothetical protein